MKKSNDIILLFVLVFLYSSFTCFGASSLPVLKKHDTYEKPGLRKLEWKKGENTLTLLHNGHVLWQYNFDKAEGKPYFHPLCTPDGTKLTWLRPDDHPWHRGIWFSWKYINGLNYWEENVKTGKSEGTTELRSVDYNLSDSYEALFHLELAYHPPEKDDLLKEKRVIRMSTPSSDGSYYMDWETTFTALADEVVLDRTPLPHEPGGKQWGGYAGFSARLAKNLQDVRAINARGEKADLHGKPSKWITYEVRNAKGKPISLTIFDHPKNLNYPNKWYIEKSAGIPFYFFNPTILFDSKYILKKGEKLHLQYRLLISPGKRDQNQLLEHWKTFQNEP